MSALSAWSFRVIETRFSRVCLGLGVIAAVVAGAWCSGVGMKPVTAAFTPAESAAEGHFEVSTVEELRNALAKLPASGGVIQVRAGDYILDAPLEIHGKHSVTLVGEGWACRIVHRGGGNAISLLDASFCEIRDILFTGDQAAQSGSAVLLRGKCSSCTVNHCRFVNFPESGVRFEGDPQHPMSSNTIRDCHFIGNLGDQLFSQNNNDFFIVGNQFGTHRGNPRTGCVLDHSSAGSYSLNYHWGNQVALRMGPAANYNRIENNRFEESRESALVIGSESGDDWNAFHIITGNTFHTNSQAKPGEFAAVVAHHAHDITFCQNQIFSWDSTKYRHKHSLVINANCSQWIVKDNHFRHNAGEALVTHSNSGILIKDNLTD